MDLPDSVVAENLDKIILRSALRLEQHQSDLAGLRKGSPRYAAATASVTTGLSALSKLRVFRSKFE